MYNKAFTATYRSPQLFVECVFFAAFEPCAGGMTTAFRVAAHVRCAAEACNTVSGCGGAVAVRVNLQSAADEHINCIVACSLRECTVGTHGTIRTNEEDIAASSYIIFHTQLAAEAVNGFYPTGFNCRNQSRMRIQDEVLADFAFQAKLFAVGRQQEFDSSGIKADTMVHGFNLVFTINTFNCHHAFEYLCIGNQCRVTGEQRLNVERFRRLDYIVNPVSRNINARQLVNDLVYLSDNNALTEFSCFNDSRSILGAEAGEQIAFSVSHSSCNESNTRGQVQEITAI